MKPSLIVPGLWAGPITSLKYLEDLQEKGLEVVVSCLPIGQLPADHSATGIRGVLSGRDLRHRIFVTSDHDTSLDPEQIADTLRDPAPTLIHCNAGQNRSTMLAICFLLLHHQLGIDEAIQVVKAARTRDLGSPPRLYKEMEANARGFAAWLRK